MHSKNWDAVFDIIAAKNCTTSQRVCEEIQIALNTARANQTSDGISLWNRIPKVVDELTAEEFLDYLLSQTSFEDS